MKDGHLTLR